MNVPYRQYHGTGNAFAVVEAAALETDRAAFAQSACAELGVDGILFLELDPETDPTRVGFTLYQPDGSTAEMCGNGARVAARWAHEQTGNRKFRLDTPAGDRLADVDADQTNVTVEMGEPTFEPAEIPVESEGPMIEEPFEGLTISAVNTGVPHAVAFLRSVEEVALEAMAQPIRYADEFPAGTNVTVAEYVGPNEFRQRTYERGVEGETQSCGTGAVAIAAVAVRQELAEAGTPIEVSPPGGTLTVTVPTDGPATLAGPTAFEREGTIEFEEGSQ
ncbi:diaminopimelate epimerase [Halodesulfurarchaeum formicicum]|uniref:Diaminopimelate epimerase n=1 Tax=Halodesulfurarchaeum formicicum TaxID=1873524 RepID=A0A1D8S584_9EURY|nr:diaminopimelate epimerase [Halodesulfurarchaeum formicicum]AOW80509.1 diaminopimelate epimerase [Halodesulfurarchaeum formicicum]